MSDLFRVGQLVEQFGKDLQQIGLQVPQPPIPPQVEIPAIDPGLPPITPVPPVIVTSQKRALTRADFTYLPDRKIVCPDVLAFSSGAMGVRIVNGQRRGIILGTKNDNKAHEIDLATGQLIQTIQPYGSCLRLLDPIAAADPTAGVQPHGACFDEATGLLVWTFGDDYNVTQRPDPSYGATHFPDLIASGPFYALPNSHRTNGYPVVTPYGIAFGAGLTSGNVGSSWGPCLYNFNSGKPYIEYSVTNRCRRNADYIPHGDPDIAPDAAGGFWTQDDLVQGCVWIDLPDAHGLLFTGSQAHGHVWYGGGSDIPGVTDLGGGKGPHDQRRVPTWWLYDPANLSPTSFEEIPIIGVSGFGILPTMTGTWVDVEKRELLCCAPMADFTNPAAPTPVIHVWKIK